MVLLKPSLTPPLFIEVPVPSPESEWSCICALGVSILPLSTILVLDGWKCDIFCFLFYLYRYTESGQKYSDASDFPYTFHIRLQYFK